MIVMAVPSEKKVVKWRSWRSRRQCVCIMASAPTRRDAPEIINKQVKIKLRLESVGYTEK